jgi:hypothetical protein
MSQKLSPILAYDLTASVGYGALGDTEKSIQGLRAESFKYALGA